MKHEQLSEQLIIPDDLKGDWADAVPARGTPWYWMQITPSKVIGWIERIAKAESKVAELEAKIAQARKEAIKEAIIDIEAAPLTWLEDPEGHRTTLPTVLISTLTIRLAALIAKEPAKETL